jgi:hypothetical protein
MIKKKLAKSGDGSKMQPAAPLRIRTVTRCSTVSAVEPNPSKDTDVQGPGSQAPVLSNVSPKGREIIEEAIAALSEIDTDGLPGLALGDTVRGLTMALESMINPVIQPRSHHHVPFNIHLNKEEAALGQAVINEVLQISSSILCGLYFLRTRGYVSRSGCEIPACWSPGDFWMAIEDARAALVRLEAINEKLGQLKSRRVRVQSPS